jgi:hypothetical protein
LDKIQYFIPSLEFILLSHSMCVFLIFDIFLSKQIKYKSLTCYKLKGKMDEFSQWKIEFYRPFISHSISTHKKQSESIGRMMPHFTFSRSSFSLLPIFHIFNILCYWQKIQNVHTPHSFIFPLISHTLNLVQQSFQFFTLRVLNFLSSSLI